MVTDEGEQLEEGIQTKVPRADDTTKWYRRPYVWVLLVLLAFAVVAAIAIPVALSTRRVAANETSGNNPTTVSPLKTESPSVPIPTNPPVSPTWFPTSSDSPTPAWTPEQIACNFLQITSLVECRATAKIPFCGLEYLNSPTRSCSFNFNERPLGARTIPSEIGLLTQLTELVLSAFQLIGTIPMTLPNLTKLTSLRMSGNKLNGTIPSSLARLSQLEQLAVSDNLLTGSIPSSLSRLTQLYNLDFGTNLLTGSIPSSLSRLTQLNDLDFGTNLLIAFHIVFRLTAVKSHAIVDDFYGACPSGSPTSSTTAPSVPTPALTPEEIACNFVQVTSLEDCRAIAKIPFCGFEYLNYSCPFGNYVPNGARTIPSEIGLLTQLTELIIFDFQLTGTIPSTLSNLPMLTYLTISGNKLNGTIPSSLASLSQLRQLDFSDNLLTGSIPSSLSGLTQLNYLRLKTNLLTGEIPASLSDLTSLWRIDLVGNSLNGTIPPSLCPILDGSSSNEFKLLIDCGEIACDCCYDDYYGAC
ncbi:hypothetical protein MHU86_15277 [Fragilaria crotonensis]|nr:hypothetical protein MHU86_15277 [Fragilaria crotonensis]